MGSSGAPYASFYKTKERKNVKRMIISIGLKNMSEEQAHFLHDSLTVISKERRDARAEQRGADVDEISKKPLDEEDARITKEDAVMWFRAMGWIWPEEKILHTLS